MVLLTSLFSRIVILIVGVLYPGYCSFKAVKYKDHRAYTTWMMYWIVFALFYTVETFTDIFVSWMPFYYEVKILVVLWLALPYTEGSKSLYRRLIHPQLINQEGQIDKLLSYTIEFAVNIVRKAWSLVVNHASTGITTAAMRVTRQQDISANEQPMVVRETHLQQEEDGFVQVSVEDQLS